MPVVTRPSFAGVYSATDASIYIKAASSGMPSLAASTRQIHRWVHEGLAGEYLIGQRGDDVALTFLDLVSMRMIAAFRKHGVKPREIRIAHEQLQSFRGWSHPFAMEPIWLFGLDLFIREAGVPVAITRYWQRAFDFIAEYLKPVHHLVFDAEKFPVKWEPAAGIMIDPQVKFGQPCLKGTGITTETLWAFYSAGETADRIARAYQIEVENVEAAIAWEKKIEESIV